MAGFAEPPAPRATPSPAAVGLQSAYVKSIRYGGVDLVDGRLHVDSRSSDVKLEIVLGMRTGQLAGVVLDTARKPAAHVTVVLAPDVAPRHRVDLYKVTTSDGLGRFAVSNIAPGDYKLFAWEDVETGAWLDPQFMRVDEPRGMPIRVVEGASLTTEVTVIRAH
jgi:hypothetical protein